MGVRPSNPLVSLGWSAFSLHNTYYGALVLNGCVVGGLDWRYHWDCQIPSALRRVQVAVTSVTYRSKS